MGSQLTRRFSLARCHFAHEARPVSRCRVRRIRRVSGRCRRMAADSRDSITPQRSNCDLRRRSRIRATRARHSIERADASWPEANHSTSPAFAAIARHCAPAALGALSSSSAKRLSIALLLLFDDNSGSPQQPSQSGPHAALEPWPLHQRSLTISKGRLHAGEATPALGSLRIASRAQV